MGKGKQAKPVAKEPEVPAREPVKVKNLYEAGALKQALDETAREVILDAGHDEDVMITNVKILLGLAAIAAALLSQFGPGKFPDNWWMVFACVVAYLLLTLSMNFYSWKMEGEAFLVTKPFRGSKGLRMSSRMARFSEDLTLVLTDRGDPRIEVSRDFRVPEFFHADGYLAESAWRSEVEKLAAEFSQAQSKGAAKKND